MVTELQREVSIPTEWYNIVPDLPKRLPPVIDPQTREMADKAYLHRIYSNELARHEYSGERSIPIPEGVRKVYAMWRPTQLVRAYRLEQALGTASHIYYKNETVSPSGSHKANAAVAQAYFAKQEGVRRLVTSTTAGQWGTALAFACAIFGLKCTIYMSRSSYDEKPYRRLLAEAWGAEIYPSPSDHTDVGREILAKNPNDPGTMSVAKSEALEDVMGDPDSRNAVGSIMNFVLASQTVIGLEAQVQMANQGEYPDLIVGCVGGGSNFSGLFWPFYRDMVLGKTPRPLQFLAAESSAVPKLTKGEYIYDHADVMKTSPLFKMYTAGHDFVPPPIHTGGLRVHGTAPTLSLLANEGLVRSVAYNQLEVFEAASLFSRTEGILPAPESAHAIKAVVDEARRSDQEGEQKVILFNLCGHGLMDIEAYTEFYAGKMSPNDADLSEVQRSLDGIKKMYPWLNG